ncbi:sugar phosphate isomerase/epimerase family protein [Methylobacterium sp. A54F]
MTPRIGFMQGRLSPPVDGKIQVFPKAHWHEEFPAAERLGLSLMEWTLDQEDLHGNPLMTGHGRSEIETLRLAHGVQIPSLTADNMMQMPFWKAGLSARLALLAQLRDLIEACGCLGVSVIVVPLVDNGSITSSEQSAALSDGLRDVLPQLRERGVRIAFESDFEPARLATFMDTFPVRDVGVNFDMGNSAALGWPPADEIPLLGSRIVNVHVKDRPRGGSTVPFGQGDVDFPLVFRLLHEAGYRGNYIIQGARAQDGDDAGILRSYVQTVEGHLHGRG